VIKGGSTGIGINHVSVTSHVIGSTIGYRYVIGICHVIGISIRYRYATEARDVIGIQIRYRYRTGIRDVIGITTGYRYVTDEHDSIGITTGANAGAGAAILAGTMPNYRFASRCSQRAKDYRHFSTGEVVCRLTITTMAEIFARIFSHVADNGIK
jgi:hypothetical protein